MADASWAITADFDKNGSYETDLTAAYIEAPGSFNIDRGVNTDGAPMIQRLSITLLNRDGTFTPGNSASALYGLLEPDVPIRVVVTHNAIVYTLFTGYIDDYEYDWSAAGPPTCRITCSDLAGKLSRIRPINVLVAERTTSAALVAIAAAAGLVAGDYSFATGAQTLPVHYVRNQDALSAMQDVLYSEMGGALYVNGLGQVVFLARDSRLGTTVAQTWGDGQAVAPTSVGMRIVTADMISNVTVQANIFIAGEDANDTLWGFSRGAETEDSLLIPAGQTYSIDIDYAGPIVAATAMVAGTDYAANSLTNGLGTDMTANLTVTVQDLGAGAYLTLKNTGGTDLYVTLMKQRGQQYEFAPDRPRIQYTKSIPNANFASGQAVALPFADDTQQTIDYAPHLVHIYRWPYPMLTLRFEAFSDAEKVAMLDLELWELVKYKDTLLGVAHSNNLIAGAMVDEHWYVTGIRHQVPIEIASFIFETEVTLIPSYLFRNLNRFANDTFNRSVVTGELGLSSSGDTWTGDGNMDIVSDGARANSDVLQMPNVTVGADDQVVEVTLSAIGAGDEVGVVLGYVDANSQYRVYVDKGSNEVILEKNVATVVTELSSPAFTVGTDHEIRAMKQGSRLRVWVDRRLYVDVTDSALTTGISAGLFARNASGTTVFNDFVGEGL